jgi:thioester reductase-like protein
MTLTSFEPNIQAARHILDLALTCTHRSSVRVFFASSISIASAWQNTSRVFPEEPVLDVDMVAGIGGYGESKFVTEQVQCTTFTSQHLN